MALAVAFSTRGPSVAERRLPGLVERYVERCVPATGNVPHRVRVAQEGTMRQKPGGRTMRFTAREDFAVDRVALAWHARFPLLGPLAIGVVDRYAAGRGHLEVRFLGIPLRRQRGRETAVGEALRYLAELPWAPYAMEHNRELEWQQLDDHAAEVATNVAGERLAVRFHFDRDGDIVRTSSESRLLETGKEWRPTPWAGEFHDYETIAGVRLPTRAEASWELPGGRFTYWQGRIIDVQLLDGREGGLEA